MAGTTIGQLSGQSAWQRALADAENARNFANAYTDYASGNPGAVSGTSGSEGGSNTVGTVDFSGMQAPTWNGPAAYNLLGLTNGQTYDEQSQAQAMLARVKQFDPNATITQGSSLNSDSGSSNTNWVLNFDQSKIPKPQYQGAVSAGQYGHDQLYNTNDVAYDPNYGAVTDPRNIKEPSASWVDKFGPALVGLIGMGAPMLFGAAGLGMGTAGAAQAAIGGANGGLAASAGGVGGLSGLSTPLATALGKGIPSFGNSIANHNFNPLSLIPYAGAGLGLPSWMTTAATTLGNLASGGKLNFNPMQLAAIAAQQVMGGGKGGK